jgi:ubiquinone/menaquinone biosynthesis C-methylase UbiE
MDVQQAYDQWSAIYDTNDNKTRDLEGNALRETLSAFEFESCLEIGCGTGKNTVWLAEKASTVTSVDLSAEMLEKARAKINSDQVEFIQADINEDWNFSKGNYDLVSFSLVLEHIQDLNSIFKKVAAALKPGGLMYVGELHPFKQYAGSRARFEQDGETIVVNCFTHHVSEFIQAGKTAGLQLVEIREVFDEGENGIPRLIVMVFQLASFPL